VNAQNVAVLDFALNVMAVAVMKMANVMLVVVKDAVTIVMVAVKMISIMKLTQMLEIEQ